MTRREAGNNVFRIGVIAGILMLGASVFALKLQHDEPLPVPADRGPAPVASPIDVSVKWVGEFLELSGTPVVTPGVTCDDLARIYRYWLLDDNTLVFAYPDAADGRPKGTNYPVAQMQTGKKSILRFHRDNVPGNVLSYVTVLEAPQGSCTSPVAGLPGWWGSRRLSQVSVPHR